LVLSSLTNPFRLSSNDFLARILESDKAENLASLFEEVGISGFGIRGFSSVTAIGFTVSIFIFSLELLLTLSLFSFLTASTIE
jgi:hypothetical protein